MLGAVYMEGGRFKYQEDPRRRNNFFYMQKFISVWCPSRQRIKDDGRQKETIWALRLSLQALITTFQLNYHNDQLLVTPNELLGFFAMIAH